VFGRLDRAGRLISADPELEALQREAGSNLGQPLALPQIAAVAQLARKLRTPVSRPALAASTDHDIELWVQATPEGDEVALSLEGWTVRAPAGPRLAAILGGGTEADTGGARNEWAADEELRIISLSPDLAELLGADPDDPGKIHGLAPYGRVAFQTGLGGGTFEVGAVALKAALFPGRDR